MMPYKSASSVVVSVLSLSILCFAGPPSPGVLLPAAADKAPQWLADEAARALPAALPDETEAVVLLDEQSTRIDAHGVLTTDCRRATRVLRPGGADEARRLLLVGSFDTKIKSMTGWVINPAGALRKVTMKQALSSSLAPDTLYMDAKIMMLAVPEVDVGSVVGFEWEAESDPPAVEDQFQFQGKFPVVRARYALILPTAWEPEFDWINWAPVEPDREPVSPLLPRKMALEIKDIPGLADEPYRPGEHALAGRLLIRLKTSNPGIRSFANWADMGAWYEELSGPRREPDGAVTVKARDLTAGAPDALSKIRALGSFAQKEIRYVSIQIGIGGFQPHPAASVLANRYGDCKDKATLLAALLKSSGIDSHYIIVHTDRGGVTPESPVSLYVFNHVVLAIRLPDDVPDAGLDSLIRHPRLGRLLVFDPTMPTTPLGRLPYYLQDNTGLLVARGESGLVRLPRASAEGNLLERKGHLVLAADGALSGEIVETRRGSEADSLRYMIQSATEAQRRQYLETFLSGSFASFSLVAYEFKNLENTGDDLIVSYRFSANAYAKRAGAYLVVRPRVVGKKTLDLASNGKKPRRYPIELGTAALARDEFTIEIPEGLQPDSLPKPLALDAGFAAYSSRTEAEGRTLVYRREYRLREPDLPASRFEDARAFYLGVAADEQQSLLLKAPEPRKSDDRTRVPR
jgi:hypothetical protein